MTSPVVNDQAERTTLSWTRALAGLVIVSAVLLHWLSSGSVLVVALLTVGLTGAVAIAATQQLRLRRARLGLAAHRLPAQAWPCTAFAATTCVLGVGGAVIVLTH